MIGERVKMGSKSLQTATKSKKLQLIRSKFMSGNELIKIQKIMLNQLAKDTRLNKVFKLVSRLLRAISDILYREFYVKGI